ncbi:hypothetical protein QYF36_025512 [Acer negundo]|nr:hypothetical protein QYF36_025512 [Acer negundo]
MGLSGMCLPFVLLHMLLLMVANSAQTTPQLAKGKPDCDTKCGDLEIPYPFGTESRCSLNDDFVITCDHTQKPPKPFWGSRSNILVTNISMEGWLQIHSFVSQDCRNDTFGATLSVGDFRISNTLNKFTVIGCDSYGYIYGKIDRYPKEIRVYADTKSKSACSYAFVIKDSQFNFSSRNLSKITEKVPTAVDWAITKQGNCTEAKSDPDRYACNENASCEDADNSAGGYLCKCKDGYQGNPYLSDGCKDVDECDQKNFTCHKHARCKNTLGNYTCKCLEGYSGDGRREGEGVGLGFVMVLVGSSWIYFMFRKRRLIELREKFFKKNGGDLLQQLSNDTTKIFTAEELKKATNNFDEKRIIGEGGCGTVYMGYLGKNQVAIKKSKIVDQSQIEQFINEVTVLLQINHRNVVKLLGCCLETEVPLLVYEYISNGTLYKHIHNNDNSTTIRWETRLRIAAETAGVLYYLHSVAREEVLSFEREKKDRRLVMYFSSSLEKGHLSRILQNGIVNNQQIKEVAELAKRCLNVKGEERPSMKDVAMELERLTHLRDNVEVSIEEKEPLHSETSYTSNYGIGSNSTATNDSLKDQVPEAFDDFHDQYWSTCCRISTTSTLRYDPHSQNLQPEKRSLCDLNLCRARRGYVLTVMNINSLFKFHEVIARQGHRGLLVAIA